ncbi:tRNA-dihydrouridine synthase A [Clostridium cavendishii DSM 21758]|uniref:tRNA-dihydrouridine synthase n=1 Tax=Clostridium cavendishii DSM 21758 TaxID=1121302 RepID=A0A1M6D3T7_9CLOT|nr:tRNA dihydrouridine(20/20a) synthase DusA [Clostridium cavendishii]SHI67743.1 tRNA-dihydrouridine synthase A [Clostridium cavendishii DSM 21758]
MEKYISQIQTPKVSIAPMVDKTHRHFRAFSRILTKNTLLYTEMISAQSIINTDTDKHLFFNKKDEGSVALQIAACNPEDAFKAVKIAENYDYDEINLNCGCPSDRVSGNLMGAALMADKKLVFEILIAMKEATKKPITIKHRIGINGEDILNPKNSKIILEGYEDLLEFLEAISKARPDRYTIHARSAILKGLSPKENREIPPLDYTLVHKLKKDFPYLNIEINGGFKTISDIKEQLTYVDGVMIGRASYENCYLLSKFDELSTGIASNITRKSILEAYLPYVEKELLIGTSSYALLNPIQSLFLGEKGSKLFKQLLSPPNLNARNGIEIINRILKELPEESLNLY